MDYFVGVFFLYRKMRSRRGRDRMAEADPGGGAPPLKLEKIRFFGVKSWFFTRNTPKMFAPPFARRNFFKCAHPPNLKSWIRPCMVVGFTTTYAISAYHHCCCEFESRSGRGVQHYVIKFVSDLRQVGGLLRELPFPPPIILTVTIELKYCWKWG